MRRGYLKQQRSQGLTEFALIAPVLLLLTFGIIDFGRGLYFYITLQQAANEGARVAVLPNTTATQVETRVRAYMDSGQLQNSTSATVLVDGNQTVSIGGAATAKASLVTVNYPFSFIVLNPVARLINGPTTLGSAFTMVATAEMRNESQ